jgi:tripartite-type tricarboxylate transporter receptor subunit TctC
MHISADLLPAHTLTVFGTGIGSSNKFATQAQTKTAHITGKQIQWKTSQEITGAIRVGVRACVCQLAHMLTNPIMVL